MKRFTFTLFVLIFPCLCFAQVQKNDAGLPYDDKAVIDFSRDGEHHFGFLIKMNSEINYVYFQNEKFTKTTHAIFDLKNQYWVDYVPAFFNPSTIDLSIFYKEIDISIAEPNRTKDGTIYAPTKNNKFISKLKHDPNAVLKNDIDGRFNGGYKLWVDYSIYKPYVYFKKYDKRKKDYISQASYNWKYQYWEWQVVSFDKTNINLEDLYSSIDLQKTKLDRIKPVENNN